MTQQYEPLQPNISEKGVKQDRTLQPQQIFCPHFIPQWKLTVPKCLQSFKSCLKSVPDPSGDLVQKLKRTSWSVQTVTMALTQDFRMWANMVYFKTLRSPVDKLTLQVVIVISMGIASCSAFSKNCLGILVSCNGRTIHLLRKKCLLTEQLWHYFYPG